MRPLASLLVTLSILAALAGCTTTSNTPEETVYAPFTFPSESYSEVFNRAIRALRDTNFTVDRVDAREGVITTRPAPSAGLATPWREHALTAEESWLNLVHQEQRVATITFSPADQQENPRDLRLFRGDIQMDIRVHIERYAESAKRHDASGVRFSHFSTGRRSNENLDNKPVRILTREDPLLTDWLHRRIQGAEHPKQNSVTG